MCKIGTFCVYEKVVFYVIGIKGDPNSEISHTFYICRVYTFFIFHLNLKVVFQRISSISYGLRAVENWYMKGPFQLASGESYYVWRSLFFKHIQQLEEFEDTKGAIRIRISKKNRQHNGQKKKYKRTNNDQQNIHIKLKIE